MFFDELANQKIKPVIFQPFFEQIKDKIKLSSDTTTFSVSEDLTDEIEFIVSLGGDGTLLDTITLVRDKKIALQAGAESTVPGGKYPGLFFFYLVPNAGHTTEENEKALLALLESFKTTMVDEASLARVKTRTRASLIHQLDSNAGLAQLLASNYANYGDWRKLFTGIDEIDKVTAQDVQRVAREYFTPQNRTIAVSVMPAGQAGEGKGDGK